MGALKATGGALFRVDAGPGVGLGHLQRCLSLASALRQRGADCVFLTGHAALSAERIAAFGFPCEVLHAGRSWGPEDLALTSAAADRRGWRRVVVDSGHKGLEYLQGLRNRGSSVCTLEDLAPFPFPCELVVNPDAHAGRLRYLSSSGDTQFLLGPRYSILREEFWRDAGPPSGLTRNGAPRRVLITLGGADPHHLMAPLLRRIAGLPLVREVTAVIGPYFEDHGEIQAAARSVPAAVRLMTAPASVRTLMEEADVAISAAGQTLYELARVGCPTVAFQMGSDQAEQLEAMAQAGCVRSVGDAHAHGGDFLPRLCEALTGLLGDPLLRRTMTAAGRRLVDGRGAHRVADAISALTTQRQTEEEVRAKWATAAGSN